jgi:hypothetical protein
VTTREPNRRTRREQSASALLWISVLFGFLGWIVISPAGRLFMLASAMLCAALAAGLGRGRFRVAAIAITLLLASLCITAYPDYRQHMDRYIERSQAVRP